MKYNVNVIICYNFEIIVVRDWGDKLRRGIWGMLYGKWLKKLFWIMVVEVN